MVVVVVVVVAVVVVVVAVAVAVAAQRWLRWCRRPDCRPRYMRAVR